MKISFNHGRWLPKLLGSYLVQRFRDSHAVFPAFPELIDIEVTNACNLQCIMCPRGTMRRKIEHMDYALFKKISRELGANQQHLGRVSLHLYGEPLLNNRLFDMIATMKEDGIPAVEFSTNCTLLDQETSKKIITSGLDKIIFAVDGAGPETYGKIRVRGDYSKVVNNIKTFFRIREEMKAVKPRVRIQIIVMTETQAEIQEFKQQWTPFLKEGDNFFIKKLGFYAYNSQLVCEQRKGLPYRVPCSLFPYKNLTILADGRATVCCYDWNAEMVVGDTATQSVVEIWRSQKMKEFCTAHFNADFSKVPLCDRCEWTTKNCEFDLKRTWDFFLRRCTGKRDD